MDFQVPGENMTTFQRQICWSIVFFFADFWRGKDVMVCTNLASRGLDFNNAPRLLKVGNWWYWFVVEEGDVKRYPKTNRDHWNGTDFFFGRPNLISKRSLYILERFWFGFLLVTRCLNQSFVVFVQEPCFQVLSSWSFHDSHGTHDPNLFFFSAFYSCLLVVKQHLTIRKNQ